MPYKPRHRLSAQPVEFVAGQQQAKAPRIGATVRHPLWPELGTGVVETHSKATEPSARVGRIRWSTGQVSTHNLATLREVD